MDTCVFDIDGTIRPLSAGKTPVPPPRPLKNMLHQLEGRGIKIAAATGASLHSARATERQMQYRFHLLAPSYCTRVLRRGNPNGPSEIRLVPKHERDAVLRVTPFLEDIRNRHKGLLDDRGACYTKFLPCLHSFESAWREVQRITSQASGIRFMANSCDFGVTVVPASASKQLFVDYLLGHRYRILIAAGDTESDAPLLKAAAYPIVTITHEGAAANACLAGIAKKKNGYIASRPHGLGLIDGLLAARDAGVVQF